MLITYEDDKEKEYYESGRFEKFLHDEDCGIDRAIVHKDNEYFVKFKITDSLKANAFFYDLMSCFNKASQPAINIENFCGVSIEQIGNSSSLSETSRGKVEAAINLLNEVISGN